MTGTTTTTRRRGDTRERIQRSALSRFTEQGYDQTSLREIAADLGVTKAAVYYHFRSKEEIVESLVADMSDRLEGLIAWAQAEPMTRERRLELLRRLSAVIDAGAGELIQCVQQNELALQGLPATVNLVGRIKHRLWEVAAPQDATVEDRLRTRLAVMAVMVANNPSSDLGGTPEERADAALRVADELMP